jgi:hypothetical protein
MPDIPPASATSASASAVAPSANNIVIETTVNSVPDKIQALARQIEVSGTLAQPPAGNTITLNTMIGPINLLLPQLAQIQQEKLLQQLNTLFQNQRPLTIVMQPGNPPSQAFLLLPSNTATVQNQSPSATGFLQPSAAAQSAPPLLPNMSVSAVVLPNGIGTSVATPGQAGQIPYAALNPNANLGGGNNSGAGFYASTASSVATPAGTVGMGASVQGASVQTESLPNTLPTQIEPAAIPVAVPAASANPVASATVSDMPQAGAPQLATVPAPLVNAAPPAAAASSVPPLVVLAAPSANAAPAPAVPAMFQSGTELNLQIDAVILPTAQNTSAPPLPQAPNQILATVIGNGPGGQPILKAGDTTLFVRQPSNLPAGTQLLATVETTRSAASTLLTLPEVQQFPALQQVMAALAQIDPVMARALTGTRIPQADTELPGTLLFFLSAIRQGDVRSWLGNGALDLLTRAGKAELVGKLMQEFQSASQSVRDNVVGEWRAYTVPLHDNNQFAALHFYVHGERERHASNPGGDKSKPVNPGQVRFLIDVRMSRLGAMQLDGFLRPRQLDIIVRSEIRLPPGLDNELRTSYAKTLAAIGYNGGLGFQTGRQGWLNMQKPPAGRAITT